VQVDVPPELVDEEGPHQGLIVGIQQRQGAEQRGEHAPPVDVADDDHRQRGGPGKAEVGEVGAPEVDLGDAAGPFADDDVEA
jgi:hypothetical protein